MPAELSTIIIDLIDRFAEGVGLFVTDKFQQVGDLIGPDPGRRVYIGHAAAVNGGIDGGGGDNGCDDILSFCSGIE
jgi:hypothetical protein